MHIQIPYTPRPLQAKLHEDLDKHRFAVLNCHRRFGKTILVILHLIRKALTNDKKNPRYYLIGPTFVSIKRVCWDYLKQYAGCIPGTTFNETELRCDLPNGARITLLSSEDPDKIRGIYADGVCIDECSQMNPILWHEIIRPALSDREGFCYFISTPAGMSNIFYELYQYALGDPKWLAYTAKSSETKLIDQEELDAAKAQMGESKFLQEFECDWIANVTGSIYGKIIQKLEDNKQITRIAYDPSLLVNTAWDLGYGDNTAIVFFQQVGNQIMIIDYYENNKEGLPHYVQFIKDKDYVYGEHYAPHDIEVTEFSNGKTRREIAYQLGIRFRVLPKLPLEDGIHNLKMVLPKCWFDADATKPLIAALRHHHRKFNDKMRIFSAKPVKDFSSHACDAARYMATSLSELPRQKMAEQKTAENDYAIHQEK